MLRCLAKSGSIVNLCSLVCGGMCQGFLRTSVSRKKNWSPFLVKICVSGVILPSSLRIGTVQMVSNAEFKFIELDSTLEQLDELHKLGLFEEEYSCLCHVLKSNDSSPDNWKLLWRLARAAYLLAQKPGQEKNRRSKLIGDALVYIQRSLQEEEQNPEAHKWYAILVGITARGYDAMKKIRVALTVKLHAEESLRYQPQDAMAHHILAVWCYHVAELNWFERRATLFLCPTFPIVSYEEALSHFETAEKICPGSASSSDLVIAAKCYLRTDQRDKSLNLLQKARGLSVRTVEDENAQSEAARILMDLK